MASFVRLLQVLVITVSVCSTHVFAQNEPANPAVEPAAQGELKPDLNAFQFTTGIGALFLKEADVTSVIADNGYTRVKSSDNTKLGLWFTAVTFTDVWARYKLAYGPFIGVQIGGSDNKIVNSFAFGVSIAPNRTDAGSSPLVFNFGWGFTTRNSLSAPYADGTQLPTGSNQPILSSSSANGPLFLVTYRLSNK